MDIPRCSRCKCIVISRCLTTNKIICSKCGHNGAIETTTSYDELVEEYNERIEKLNKKRGIDGKTDKRPF